MNRLTRTLSIAAGALLIFGCTSELTAPGAPTMAEARGGETQFTLCQAQPPAFTSGWIGPKGGYLKAGRHVLKVPSGALSKNVLISMEAPSSSINRVHFEPSGLTFNSGTNAFLVMSYAHCSVEPGYGQEIVQINSKLKVLEVSPSVTDTVAETVEGKLFHFSDYALSTYAVVY